MSRGLGQLQREILTTLEDAKSLHSVYMGCDDGERVTYHGRRFCLEPGVYDMRASAQFLARVHDEMQTGLSLRKSAIAYPAFAASFCRAVRGLVSGGYLETWSAPIHHSLPWGVTTWANRRLVRRTQKPFCPISPVMYNAYLACYRERMVLAGARFERLYNLQNQVDSIDRKTVGQTTAATTGAKVCANI